MNHFFDAIQDTKGNALIGYYVRVVDPASGNGVSLYADPSLTPIISVSGVADAAKVDSDGNVDFYCAVGTYRLDIYATDATTFVKSVNDVGLNIDADTAATAVAAQNAAAASATAAAASATAAAQLAAGIGDISAAENAIIAALAAGGSVSLSTLETSGLPYQPEWFGAKGDGTTNDTAAFQALATVINMSGGGTISLKARATYLVGLQTLVNDGTFMWKGQDILTISGCTSPFKLIGNGAKFKLASSLKFGTFNSSGASTTHTLPYTGGDLSTVVPEAVVTVKNCTARVILDNFEVDGNQANLNIGGQFGDTGYQVPGDGVALWSNTAGETVTNVYAHHCPRDNFSVIGGNSPIDSTTPKSGSVFMGCKGLYAGRSNMSFTGGRGFDFIDCNFNLAGKATIASAPNAGVDLEAEVGKIRDIRFTNCDFRQNAGNALVADSGDTQRVRCEQCIFVGSDSWAGWVVKPYFTFEDCIFAGPVTLSPTRITTDIASPNAALPVFTRCTFTDDTAYSSTGSLYTGGEILNASDGSGGRTGIVFDKCHFRANYTNYLASTASGGTFKSCSFDISGAHAGGALANADFSGDTTITTTAGGRLELFAAGNVPQRWAGKITYNGTAVRSGSKTYDPPSVAAGASFSTTVTVPWATKNDIVKVAFSNPNAVSFAASYVSTPITDEASTGVVTVVGVNQSGSTLDLASGTLNVSVEGVLV